MPSTPRRHLEMLNIPVDLYGSYADHVDRVARAALTAEADDPATTVELQAAGHLIVGRFGPMRERNRLTHAEAVARGDTVMEFILDLPEDVADSMLAFLEAVEQLDSAARTGKADLPVATSEVAAFRRWLVGEAVAQRNGQDPTPFSWRVIRVLAATRTEGRGGDRPGR